jgi:hypothetical protein
MVWLYRSPILVGMRWVFFSFKWFLPAFAAFRGRGEGHNPEGTSRWCVEIGGRGSPPCGIYLLESWVPHPSYACGTVWNTFDSSCVAVGFSFSYVHRLMPAWYPPFVYPWVLQLSSPPSLKHPCVTVGYPLPPPLAPDAINDVEKIKLSVKMFIVAGDLKSPFFNPLHLLASQTQETNLEHLIHHIFVYFYCGQN